MLCHVLELFGAKVERIVSLHKAICLHVDAGKTHISFFRATRADLEAAAKAKSKLSSGSSTADSRMIADLHQELNQLEGLSSHLPALAQRLEQLAHIHVQSSSAAVRLTGAEQDVRGIQVTLQSMEKALSALETNMVENTKIMDANLKAMVAQVSQM